MASHAPPTEALHDLSKDLSALCTALEPVLSAPLQTLVERLESGSSHANPGAEANRAGGARGQVADADDGARRGRLDAAKLQTSLAYTLCAVIWAYLRTTGADPAQHAVHAEMERVLRVFERIKAVEARLVAE